MTSIEPGLVRTEFAGSSRASADAYYANLPFGPLEAEDVALAVLYVVSRPEHISVDEVAVRPTKQRNLHLSLSALPLSGSLSGRAPGIGKRGTVHQRSSGKEKDRDCRHGPC